MLEIDEVVVKACAKYMRSICGEVLDKMDGPNYKVLSQIDLPSFTEFTT